uniref:CD28 molecule n=2 Tax=Cynoglossus semilaevis TaxID=244447 RepID=A0A3P8VPD4_CYNSE
MSTNVEMRVCWMLVIVLGCSWSEASKSLGKDCGNVQLRSFCSICNTPVLVPCPNITAAEMVFKLFKDQEYLSNISCIHSNSTLTCELSKTSADIQVQKHQQEKSVSFLLTGVTDSSQGIYGCEGTKKFPPPMITVQSDVRIQVLQGHICKCKENSRPSGEDPQFRLDLLLIILVVLLSIYSIIFTIIAVVQWVKQRSTDSHNDYINTKPRAPQDRKRNKGVQKPVPRHF